MTIKCVDCEERITAEERFHREYTYTEVDGLPVSNGDSKRTLIGLPNNVCCNCLGHTVGWCKETIASSAFLREFNKAYLRSTGGIGRQGLKL